MSQQKNVTLDKVLIVDDDPEVRSLLREQVLDSRRFEVSEAGDGAEGLAQIKQQNPDLIILDLIMPGLSGIDFLVALKSQGFAGPVIVSTKRGSEAQAIDAFRLGATDYLTKPIREAEALRTIEHGRTVTEVPITFTERARGASKMSRAIVAEALWRVAKWGVASRLGRKRRGSGAR